jgi:hypothetical protein
MNIAEVCDRAEIRLPPRLSPPPPWYGTMNHHRPTLPES